MSTEVSVLCDRILRSSTPQDVLSQSGINVRAGSSRATVRAAYLSLVGRTHPDKCGLQTREAFQAVTSSYRALIDPENLADGWQDDEVYKEYTEYTGKWYQDDTGTWFTDYDYRNEEGKWCRRTDEEVDLLFGLQDKTLKFETLSCRQRVIFDRVAGQQRMWMESNQKKQGLADSSQGKSGTEERPSLKDVEQPVQSSQQGQQCSPRTTQQPHAYHNSDHSQNVAGHTSAMLAPNPGPPTAASPHVAREMARVVVRAPSSIGTSTSHAISAAVKALRESAAAGALRGGTRIPITSARSVAPREASFTEKRQPSVCHPGSVWNHKHPAAQTFCTTPRRFSAYGRYWPEGGV